MEGPPLKRPRGSYRQYLIPGNNPIIPESTLRSREAARRNLEEPSTAALGGTSVGSGGRRDISDRNFADNIIGLPAGTPSGAAGGGNGDGGGTSSDDSSSSVLQSHIAGFNDSSLDNAEATTSTGNFAADMGNDQVQTLLATCEDLLTSAGSSAFSEEGEQIITSALGSLLGRTGETQSTEQIQSLAAREDFNKKRAQFWKRHGLEERLHPNIETTRFEALLMILHLALRHHHTGAFIIDLMKFVNGILGREALSPSLHIFTKTFSTSITPQYHFLCPKCHLYLGEQTSFIELSCITCQECETKCDVSNINSPDVFISVPIAKQIQDLLRRPDIKLVSDRPSSEDIRDVMDGELYKDLAKKAPGSNFLTVCFNTDGVQAFETPPKSLWPILLVVNELIPVQRLKPENSILAGLYFGRGAPDMCWFFRPFVEEFRVLAKDGVWASNGKGQNILFRVYALIATLDLIAKAKLQVSKQFNGMFGCGFCLHPNYVMVGEKRIFGYHADKSYPLRTHDSIRLDMITAHDLAVSDELRKLSETSVRGALGLSPTLGLPEFNVVDGFAIDYMHNGAEGVMPLLVRIWFDGQYKGEAFYLAPHLSKIDEQLLSLRLPSPMTAKSLSTRSEWKAKDWRAFFLYYGLPILKQFLPERYYNHFAKFAVGMYLLLKETITRADLNEAELLLTDFVKSFQQLYPKELMTHNVHLLLHYPNRVSKLGPLWGCSNFVFESCNGRLLKYLEGTKLAAHEIVKKYLIMQSVPECFKLSSSPVRKEVVDFCTDVCCFSTLQKYERVSDGVLTSVAAVEDISPEEVECLKDVRTHFPPGKIMFYNRIIKDQIVFCSKSYSRLVAHDNSCAQLTDESYAVIDKIVKFSEEDNAASAIIKPIRISNQSEDHLAPHIKSCAFDMFEPIRVVPFSDVSKRCVLVSVRSSETEIYNYACDYPNFL